MAISKQTTRTIKLSGRQNIKATAVYETAESAINNATVNIPLSITIRPGITPEQTKTFDYKFVIDSNKIQVNLSDVINKVADGFLSDIVTNYIDEDRELKTLLNYGDDKQTVIINQRYGPKDQAGVNTIQLKLLQPLPDDIELGRTVFVSREVTNTVIDTTKIRYAPAIDNTPYLRPKNMLAKANVNLGASLNNVTLKVLGLETASVGGYTTSNNISFEDSVMRQWYSFDFNSSELNIDFTDYNNFVFYGSAAMRLAAFKEKVRQLNDLDAKIQQFAGSVFTGSLAFAGSSYILEQSARFAKEKETLIRSFDRYEQYLYFTPSGSNSAYSASAYYADSGMEYNSIGYWPKDTNGNLYQPSTTQADDWYNQQIEIAQRFDEFNENNLVNTLPMHIRDNDDSSAYITFVAMIGHFFDIIKPYIDQFPNIYDRALNPDTGLSKDLIIEIADSVGFPLPTLNSVYNLSDNVLGTDSTEARRDFTSETYKRLLHNIPFFVKSKGTRSSLNALLTSFGISNELINIKEIGTSVSSSLYVFDEYTNGLEFTGTNSYVKLPLSQSLRTPAPKSIQLNISTVVEQDMTVMRGDNKWALKIATHPTIAGLGRFELTSGSTTILTSSYQPIFDDELLNVTIRTYDTGSYASLFVVQTNDDDIIFSSSMSETSGSGVFVPMWSSSAYIYIGGTGSLVTNQFQGTIDEVRLWGMNLTDEMVINTAFDPGSNAGNDYTDAADYLYTQLSFDKIDFTSVTSSLLNETPYKDITIAPSLEYIDAVGLNTGSFVRYSRSVRQVLPEIGSTGYVTKKVRVAQPPVFITDESGVKTLSRTTSIVPVSQKQRQVQLGKNKISISTSPTEIVNQNIIRNIGLENINAALGSPSELYKALDADLETLRDYYNQYYYVDVDINKYIRILSAVTSVLNDVIDYFIPAKTTLQTGVVIEPNALEQIKIKPLRKIRVYGANTRKTMNAPGSLTGSVPDYQATFNLAQKIDTRNTLLPSGLYETYDRQTENWLDSELISQSLKPSRPSTIRPNKQVVGGYETYDRQSENWLDSELISQSLKPSRPAFIDAHTLSPSGQFVVYELQHLDWLEYRTISNSYAPGTEEFTSASFQPWPKVTVDMGTIDMNKIGYYDANNGKDGAEPFKRVYPRKMFDFEISASRPGGSTSINTNVLYEIQPSCDFRDLGTYTYFSSPYGIYYYPEIKKTPQTKRRLKSVWNFESQSFDNEVTWAYGTSYVLGDVVYQSVTRADISENYSETDSVTYDATRKGNGKYYVYKTPSYYPGQPAKISYIPPSLDNTNWERLYFRPVKVFEPKRVVFETFTVADPSLNNYLTTTISVDKVIDIPNRYVDSISIGNIAGNSYVQGEVAVQNIALLFAVQSNNSDIRIRLYRTDTDRNNDVSRDITTTPDSNAGVLLDMLVNGFNVAELINPIQTLVADSQPPAGKIFYTINNQSATTKIDINLLLYYFAVEVESRVPLGYLKKHYRFFRDNATATKRRNYEGCKNTIDTTIDGLPPIQVFITEGTEVTVAPRPSRRNPEKEEIKPGSGGKLDVSGPVKASPINRRVK